MSAAPAAAWPADEIQIPTTMPALVKAEAGAGAVLQEVPVPTIGDLDILVHVDAASICGTDLHIYDWDPWASNRMRPPIIIGHECCGTVVRTGSAVTRVKVGDFVAAESHVVCHQCRECRQGDFHACRNVKILGVDRPGAFAGYVSIPEENAWPVSRSLPPEIATIEEPMGNAVHTVSAAGVAGANVAIFGLGPLGLFAIRIAQVYGAATVYGVEVSPYRSELGMKMGASRVLNPVAERVVDTLTDLTNGEGVDVVLEMSGNQTAINDGLKSLRHEGTMAMLGLPSQPLAVDFGDDVIFKGLTIKGIVGRRIPETWNQTRGLLEAGVDMSPIITHRMPLTEFEHAFELLHSGRSGKIVIYPNGEPER
jgi:threonine 3-dehydrogenase